MFVAGLLSPQARKIMQQRPPQPQVGLVWTPAYAGLVGDEGTHKPVRCSGARPARDRIVSYQEIIMHYRLSSGKLPSPNALLASAQENTWRFF